MAHTKHFAQQPVHSRYPVHSHNLLQPETREGSGASAQISKLHDQQLTRNDTMCRVLCNGRGNTVVIGKCSLAG